MLRLKKRKILIFIGSLTSGGAERVTVSLSKYLARVKNFSVVVVTLNDTIHDFYTLDSRVKRIAMSMGGATSGINKFTRNVQRLSAFRKIVKQEKPDLVLGMITRHAVLSILACIGLSVKVVVSERNYPGKRKNHSMWEILRKYVYRYADCHVVQTKKIEKWISTNTKSKKIYVIPNSIMWPLPSYEPVLYPNDYIEEDKNLILAVGSFKAQKGFDLLLEAMTGLLQQYPNWKLVILGGKVDESEDRTGLNLKEELKSLAAKNKIESQVIMPGKAGNVADWYDRADIFVLSSRFEGFPNVLLEAMASGTASVSFDCDTGPGEMIVHEENGLLVAPFNILALQNAVETLMNDKILRQKLSVNAVETRKIFAEDEILASWSDVLDAVLEFKN